MTLSVKKVGGRNVRNGHVCGDIAHEARCVAHDVCATGATTRDRASTCRITSLTDTSSPAAEPVGRVEIRPGADNRRQQRREGRQGAEGDGWGRGGLGREGGRQPGAAGGRASQQHQEGESAAKDRAVGGWMGVRTPGLVADGVETRTRRRPARPQRVLRGQPQPPEGVGWPPNMPCHQAEQREASAPPGRGGRRL